MIQLLRRLVAVGVVVLVSVGCQKGAQSGAKENREASGRGSAAKSSETGKGAGGSEARSAGTTTAAPAARESRLTLTQPESGKYLELRQGQVVTVVLSSNRSSGASWSLAEPSGPVLVQDGKSVYSSTPASAGDPGGSETWRFRAAQRGEQSIRLEYGRSWQQSVPERTFSFRASVR